MEVYCIMVALLSPWLVPGVVRGTEGQFQKLCGVSQGSMLLVHMLLVYMKLLGEVVNQNEVKYHQSVDNTQLNIYL